MKVIKIRKPIREDLVFDIVNYSFLFLILVIIIYPMYFIIIASISDPARVARNEIVLLPKGFTLESYNNVFKNGLIWTGYRNTIIYTVCGTLFNLLLTIPSAYTLSKKDLPLRRPILFIFTFTMYFSGGLIPMYLLVRSLGLLNTPFVMMILGGVSVII